VVVIGTNDAYGAGLLDGFFTYARGVGVTVDAFATFPPNDGPAGGANIDLALRVRAAACCVLRAACCGWRERASRLSTRPLRASWSSWL
jgi:hypothetical protein